MLLLCALTMCRKKYVVGEPAVEKASVIKYDLIADTPASNKAFGGYYVALPPHYKQNTARHPLLVFLHGLGQRGNGREDLKYLLYDGIGKVLADTRMPEYFTVNREKFSLVIVSPQYQQQPDIDDVMNLVEEIANKYRIRSNRIYLSGLSLGARITTLVAAAHPNRFAAIVPIAGVATNEGMKERCEKIADANLPVWELHNADDPMANVEDARAFIDYLTSFSPPIPPRFTVFDRYGHDAWTTALDTAYREGGMNIYEWMLQYRR